jgi:protein SCO1/2
MNIPIILIATSLLLTTTRIVAAEACCATPPAPAETWSSQSLFHIESTFKTQIGKETNLAALKGRPTVVAMFYASCSTVCPRLITVLKDIEERLPEDKRGQFRVVLISFDPERDTPEALAAFAKNWGMDPERWQLWSGAAADVRTVAASLGVRYRSTPDGEFSHSAPIILLNAEGEIDKRLEPPGGENQKVFEAHLLEVLSAS